MKFLNIELFLFTENIKVCKKVSVQLIFPRTKKMELAFEFKTPE